MANQVAEMFLYNPQNFAETKRGLRFMNKYILCLFFGMTLIFFRLFPGDQFRFAVRQRAISFCAGGDEKRIGTF